MAAKKSKKAAPKKKSPAKKAKSNKSSSKKSSEGPRRQAAAGLKTKTKTRTETATPTANRAGKRPAENGMLPTRDGVLVERVQESDRTPGGLFIPQTAMERPLKGLVVRAGKGKFSKRGKLRPLDVQPGDEVLFGKYAGTEIKIDGKEFLLIREDEILGVVS